MSQDIDIRAGVGLTSLRGAAPFLRPYYVRLILALLCLCAASAAALGMPVAIRLVIDQGFSRQHGAEINHYFLALFGLAAAFAVFAALRYYLVMWIGERVVADIRSAVYEHVIGLSQEFFESSPSGEILSRLTADTTLVQSVVGAGLSIALRSSFMLLGALIMLFVTSPRLTGLILVLVPIIVVPVLLYGRKVRRLSRTSQDRVADTSAIAGETLNAIQIVQAFTLEGFQARRFREAVERAFEAARRRLSVSALLSGVIVLVAFGAIVFVLWMGARSVVSGAVSAGTLGQFLLYATIVAGSTTALGEVWGGVQRAAGAMERLVELLNTVPSIKTPASPARLPGEGGGYVSVEQVVFCYPSRSSQPALNDVTLEVRPGECVALVGPSGAGKSTVFQLLLRFYDPQSGRICIDGVDISRADPRDVRRCMAVVPQQNVLFAATVLENIRCGRPEADDAAVLEAARAALVDDFVAPLPDAYGTFVGERGVRLSGGQQQRIAIARAILRDAPILLLDEATSALDTESERLVQAALKNLMKRRTTVIIAHRLSTVRQADRIVVMNAGRIVGLGQHEELMRNNSLYARLARFQLADNRPAAGADEGSADRLPI